MSNTNRLGELLVREKLISLAQLRQAQDEQNRSGQNLGYTLAQARVHQRRGDHELSVAAVPRPDDQPRGVRDRRRGPEARLEGAVARSTSVIPVSRAGSSLIVAMADPTNLHAIDDIKFLTGYNVEPVVASETAIARRGRAVLHAPGPSYDEVMAGFDEEEIEFAGDDEELNVLELEKASEDAPVVRLVNMILLNAIKKGASDIHIEPYEKKLRVRYRIDGVLIEEMTPPLKLKNAIVEPPQDHELSSTSPSAASRRTDASSSSSARAARWTSASASCRRSGARRSSCVSSTRGTCSST